MINAKPLKIASFHLCHIFLRLGKLTHLPNQLCKTVGMLAESQYLNYLYYPINIRFQSPSSTAQVMKPTTAQHPASTSLDASTEFLQGPAPEPLRAVPQGSRLLQQNLALAARRPRPRCEADSDRPAPDAAALSCARPQSTSCSGRHIEQRRERGCVTQLTTATTCNYRSNHCHPQPNSTHAAAASASASEF